MLQSLTLLLVLFDATTQYQYFWPGSAVVSANPLVCAPSAVAPVGLESVFRYT